MRGKSAAIFVIVLAIGIAASGCWERAEDLAAPGGVRASWKYVEDAWGGLAAGEPRISAGGVTLPLRLGVHESKRTDSALCITDLGAGVKRHRIVVHLHKGICGVRSVTTYAATFPHPEAGTYPVVYDDLLAGFPKIGEVRIP